MTQCNDSPANGRRAHGCPKDLLFRLKTQITIVDAHQQGGRRRRTDQLRAEQRGDIPRQALTSIVEPGAKKCRQRLYRNRQSSTPAPYVRMAYSAHGSQRKKI
eukprot:1861975-Pleurochrysis_carterae.AAC.1